jgi:fructokinase
MVVWSIGEVLWDIFPTEEHLGGAALNFSANLHRLGAQVTFISGVGKDDRGRRALDAIAAIGLNTNKIAVGDKPTGVAVIESGPGREDQRFVIPRPAAFDSLDFDPAINVEAERSGVEWIYVGTLLQTNAAVERFTADLVAAAQGVRVFYDVNLRDGHWNLGLVRRLSSLSHVLKLNEAEAELLFELTHPGATFDLPSFCEWWSKAHEIDVMCVTLGAEGAVIFSHGSTAVELKDTVGAGDAFAAAFLYAYHHKWTLANAACFANALGAFVASQAGAIPPWTIQEVLSLIHPDSRSSMMSLLVVTEEAPQLSELR